MNLRVLLAIVAIGCLAVFLVEYDRRQDLYWYDVGQDYEYGFGAEGAKSVTARITAESAVLPIVDAVWDTAVLRFRVRASALGHWFEPTIAIGSGDRRTLHTLERGTDGLRYFVLDPAAVQADAELELSGRHVDWQAQEADLLLFATPEARDGRLLVVATHPDDAEIAAFGLYSGRDAYVVTVSAGNYVDGLYSHLAEDAARQDRLRGEARAWDSVVVPAWGGVEPGRSLNLGYWNGSLRGLYEDRNGGSEAGGAHSGDPNLFRRGALEALVAGRAAQPRWASLVEDLRLVVASVEPDVIATPHPALDSAPDHQYTTWALLEALEALGVRDTTLLLYTNHHVLSEYYPFGPSDSAVTLPPWFDAEQRFGAIYSYPLDARARMRKLFALEAMHDLRAAPRLLHGGPGARFLTRLEAAIEDLIRNPLGTYSYVRRAVRQNEIFFVARPRDLERLGRPE